MGAGSDLNVKGDLTASEDVTIDFTLEGSIDVTGHRLVITEGGRVQAAVAAAAVIVKGPFDGHISADRVELGPTAQVTATIVSSSFVLHDGAQFTGPVNTDRAQAAVSVTRHRKKSAQGSDV